MRESERERETARIHVQCTRGHGRGQSIGVAHKGVASYQISLHYCIAVVVWVENNNPME